MTPAPPPVMSSDQILQHVDSVYQGLPDPVKAALDHAHTLTGGAPATSVQDAAKPTMPPMSAAPSPMASSGSASPMMPGMIGPRAGDAAAPSTAPAIAPAPIDREDPLPLMGSTPRPNPIVPNAPSSHAAEFNRLTAPALPSGDPNAHTSADTGRSGIQQIHNPWLRGLATVGDAIGGGFFPRVAQFIPGTTLHHQMLVNEQKGALGEEQAGAKNAAEVAREEAQTEQAKATTAGLPAEQQLRQAEAQNYLSEAEARKNPDLQVVTHPVIDPNDPNKAPRTGYFNKKTGAMTYGPEVAAAPVNKTPTNEMEKFFADNPKASSVDWEKFKSDHPAATHFNAEESALLRAAGGDPNKPETQTLEVMKKYEDLKKEKPPNVSINQGTWSIQEDASGNPIEYNSKTGETRQVAAGGVQKAGTQAKVDAAKEPAKNAMNYAESYLQNGVHTGPGDEALQEKFFELAKPATGFRMTQPQISMLANSRSWMSGMEAHLRHATTGTWFNDEQRKQIVDTMRDLAKAKGIAGESAAPAANALPGGITMNDIDAELALRKGGK